MNVKTLVEQCEDLGTLPCCATYPKNNHYTWENGEDVFNWWLGIDENQVTFFEEET